MQTSAWMSRAPGFFDKPRVSVQYPRKWSMVCTCSFSYANLTLYLMVCASLILTRQVLQPSERLHHQVFDHDRHRYRSFVSDQSNRVTNYVLYSNKRMVRLEWVADCYAWTRVNSVICNIISTVAYELQQKHHQRFFCGQARFEGNWNTLWPD